jgi:hypothetical protein
MARTLPTPGSVKALFRGSLEYSHYIFAATLLVRLISLTRLNSSPFLLPNGSDMQFYDDWAKQILHGHWTDHRAFYGLPLYPFVLAFFYRLFGLTHFVPGLIQACLEAGTAVLIYKITVLAFGDPASSELGDDAKPKAKRIDAAKLVGAAAAAGWIFFVPAQAYSIILMPTAMSVFVFWYFTWEILKRTECPSPGRSLGLGTMVGVAAMAVATSLIAIPLALIACFTRWRAEKGRPVMAATLLLTGVVIGTAPCWIHNFLVARDPVFLSAHGGINLWLGNNPDATGYPRFPGLHAGQSQLLRDSIEQAETAAGRELKRSEVSRYWSSKARTYIANHPGDWLRLIGRKITNFWNTFEYDDLGVIRNLREHGVLFPGLHFGIAAAFGLAGLIFAWRPFPNSRWIAAAVVLQVLAILPIFVTERYRLVVVPGLLILGALGLAQLWKNFAVGAFVHATAQLAILVATALFVTMPRNDPSLWALNAYNAGRLALDLHDLPRAEQELQRARSLVPDNNEIIFALGNLRLAQGDRDAARSLYEAVLKADPKHKAALNNLGVVALDQNAPKVAVEYFARLAALQPHNPKTLYLLATALLRIGDPAGAEAALSRALEIAPDQPELLALREQLHDPKP